MNPPAHPTYSANIFETYDKSFLEHPRQYRYETHMEESIQRFNPNYHFAELVHTDMPIIRDACAFYKHKTQNVYLKYDSGNNTWEDITLIYQDLWNTRTNNQKNRKNVIERLGL